MLDLLQWVGVGVLLIVSIVLVIRSRRVSRPSGECVNCVIKDQCSKRGKRRSFRGDKKSEDERV